MARANIFVHIFGKQVQSLCRAEPNVLELYGWLWLRKNDEKNLYFSATSYKIFFTKEIDDWN